VWSIFHFTISFLILKSYEKGILALQPTLNEPWLVMCAEGVSTCSTPKLIACSRSPTLQLDEAATFSQFIIFYCVTDSVRNKNLYFYGLVRH